MGRGQPRRVGKKHLWLRKEEWRPRGHLAEACLGSLWIWESFRLGLPLAGFGPWFGKSSPSPTWPRRETQQQQQQQQLTGLFWSGECHQAGGSGWEVPGKPAGRGGEGRGRQDAEWLSWGGGGAEIERDRFCLGQQRQPLGGGRPGPTRGLRQCHHGKGGGGSERAGRGDRRAARLERGPLQTGSFPGAGGRISGGNNKAEQPHEGEEHMRDLRS